ncbi:MAG: hypothetical protein JW703_05165 [Candidatus Diapherotrites archaeon]|nr:hypothetical protein [Candidatus Diapherotrites archaeon]
MKEIKILTIIFILFAFFAGVSAGVTEVGTDLVKLFSMDASACKKGDTSPDCTGSSTTTEELPLESIEITPICSNPEKPCYASNLTSLNIKTTSKINSDSKYSSSNAIKISIWALTSKDEERNPVREFVLATNADKAIKDFSLTFSDMQNKEISGKKFSKFVSEIESYNRQHSSNTLKYFVVITYN